MQTGWSAQAVRMDVTGCLLGTLSMFALGCTKPADPPQPDWYPKDPPPLVSAAASAAYRGCREDSDCVYVQNGCCDCANGGEELAVHKAKLAAFQTLFQCAQVSCTERGRRPPCGTGTSICQANLCEFQPAAQ